MSATSLCKMAMKIFMSDKWWTDRVNEAVFTWSPVWSQVFTWSSVRSQVFTGEAAVATFALVVTLRTFSHLGAPWSPVAVLTVCHTARLSHYLHIQPSPRSTDTNHYNAVCWLAYYDRTFWLVAMRPFLPKEASLRVAARPYGRLSVRLSVVNMLVTQEGKVTESSKSTDIC